MVGNRWDGRETARRQQELGLGLDLGSDLELGFRLGFPLDIGAWQVSRGSKHTRRA